MKRRFMALCLAGSMLLMTALTGCQRAAEQANEGQENAGQKNVEQRMEREFVREDILQSRQLDFSNMERQQKTYYERQVKEVVEQMVTELGNSCGVPVQKVEVTLTQDTGAVAQVTVWTAVSGKTIQQEMRRQTAEACGIGEQQVEVYGS